MPTRTPQKQSHKSADHPEGGRSLETRHSPCALLPADGRRASILQRVFPLGLTRVFSDFAPCFNSARCPDRNSQF